MSYPWNPRPRRPLRMRGWLKMGMPKISPQGETANRECGARAGTSPIHGVTGSAVATTTEPELLTQSDLGLETTKTKEGK